MNDIFSTTSISRAHSTMPNRLVDEAVTPLAPQPQGDRPGFHTVQRAFSQVQADRGNVSQRTLFLKVTSGQLGNIQEQLPTLLSEAYAGWYVPIESVTQSTNGMISVVFPLPVIMWIALLVFPIWRGALSKGGLPGRVVAPRLKAVFDVHSSSITKENDTTTGSCSRQLSVTFSLLGRAIATLSLAFAD